MFLEPAVESWIVRQDAKDFGIEARRVVELLSVAELVHHDAVQYLRRGEQQKTVEVEVSF